jgi:hypothetical protein
MKIFTPIYNEMPWTPFLLNHLLEYDCPIVIGEGAADSLQHSNPRSTDGSLEIVKEFAKNWKDRVQLFYFNRKTISPKHQFGRRLPKHQIKFNKCWDTLKDGELMLALAPDNYYKPADVAKIKKMESDPYLKDKFQILTFMHVFQFNFKKIIVQREKGLCGPWFNLWPCIYRKNPKWVITVGSEMLMLKGTRRPICGTGTQGKRFNKYERIHIANDVVNMHYKGVKKLDSRVKRFGIEAANRWHRYPLYMDTLKPYDGPHPSVLDDHPWRNTKDCRRDKQNFNYKDFLYLVQRR